MPRTLRQGDTAREGRVDMIMKLRRMQRGFTLSETLVVAYLVSVLS